MASTGIFFQKKTTKKLLLAITSAHKAGELNALCSDPQFIRFHSNNMVLRLDFFLPEVVSVFHIYQDLMLPVFFQSIASEGGRNLWTSHWTFN